MYSSRWAVVLVASWLGVCALAFWWFEYRHWVTFDTSMVQFDSKAINALYPILNSEHTEQILVVHFSDDHCPCERYRKNHVNNLVSVLRATKQVVIQAQSNTWAKVMNSTAMLPNIPATPAVAIWDKQGTLAYFGPYSSGMTCGSGFDFVSMVLEKLSNSVNPNWINTQGVGCFCPWRSKQ